MVNGEFFGLSASRVDHCLWLLADGATTVLLGKHLVVFIKRDAVVVF